MVEMPSAMDVDGAPDSGVEEMKGESTTVSSADASATAAAAETSHQKGKGEGDRNVMLHPVCSLIPTHEIIGGCRGGALWLLVSVFSSFSLMASCGVEVLLPQVVVFTCSGQRLVPH